MPRKPGEWALVRAHSDAVRTGDHEIARILFRRLARLLEADVKDEEHERWIAKLSAIATDDEGLSDALDRVIDFWHDHHASVTDAESERAAAVAYLRNVANRERSHPIMGLASDAIERGEHRIPR